jgi:hypothetical protein
MLHQSLNTRQPKFLEKTLNLQEDLGLLSVNRNYNLTPDGLGYGERVSNFNYQMELSTIVDAVLNSTTLASHILYNAKNFNHYTLLKTVKAIRRTQFQEVSGLEPLNGAAENVTIQMAYNRALFSMPTVKILAEAFARQYDQGIDYDAFEYEDVLDETLYGLTSVFFNGGTNFVGLNQITDDGSLFDDIGGSSRATYGLLKGKVSDYSGTGSLSKLAATYTAISDTGPNEAPSIIATTFDVFDLIESLYLPTVRHEYKTLPVGGRYPTAHPADGMGNGFSTLDWRGIPILKDKAIAAGYGYMLNLNYLNYYGDQKVPQAFSKFLTPVKLGKASVKEGQATMRPSDYAGFFFQEEQMMPNAGGTVGRFWVSGQLTSFQPRRQARFINFNAV